MQLRVRNGKGVKGRVLPLSERLLQELENYWRAQRQGKAAHDSPWLFLGKKAGQPMRRYTGQNIYCTALEKSGVRQGRHPSFEALVCHSPHGKRRRTTSSPSLAGPFEHQDYGALSPCDGTQASRGALTLDHQ